MPGGSTKRQCPHCLEKSNCANRRCTKCGKMLELKPRHTARMKDFRQNAKDWAQKVHWSRNQSKIFDNSVLMVEKLKALGYFPLLFWGKYHNKNKKWTAQLQCPFELPLVAHAVLEKMVCLFEGFLEEEEFGPVVAGEMEAGKEKEQVVEVEKEEFEAEKKAIDRKRAVKISAKKKRGKKKQNKEEVCEYHSKLDAFPVQSVSKTRERL
ncbi:uncharacterized protein isoform X2 [Notothenia coriiceps]|uniref:Uncharacterized protein isoform X2 n=1 Tax=Notothenia coriiceps TaxID=8208 RepID=A0A6I9NCH9_9TELE|nr:PREDICTED: uncharacterized protein LOC104947713 isoform X2 [Notothenia coriiceps]